MSIPLGYKYLRYCERGKIPEGGILEVPPFLGFTYYVGEYFSKYLVIYMGYM